MTYYVKGGEELRKLLAENPNSKDVRWNGLAPHCCYFIPNLNIPTKWNREDNPPEDGQELSPEQFMEFFQFLIDRKLVIGKKYIPLKKSTWGNLEASSAWRKAQKLKQPYLYYKGKSGEDEGFWPLLEGHAMDFFLPTDVIPYFEKEKTQKMLNTLELGQKVEIFGYTYTVKHGEGFDRGYYLSDEAENNDRMFNQLGVYSNTFVGNLGIKHTGGVFPEVGTLEELTRIVNAILTYKKETTPTEMKKIKEYKLIKLIPFQHYKLNDTFEVNATINGNKVANNPEYFEPVYEEEFKVGDWVTTNSVGVSPARGNTTVQGGSGFKPNVTLQITEISKYPDRTIYFFKDHQDGIYNGNFRKATPEEIKNAQLVKIGNYTVELKDGKVAFGCQEFTRAELEVVHRLLDKEVQATITIRKTPINLAMINKLLSMI